MLNCANIPMTVKTICNHMNKGKITFNFPAQRNLVWDEETASIVIHSIISRFIVPALVFAKGNGVYDCLDGKQRCNFIKAFIDGEFPLADITPPVKNENGEMEDISGCFFENLPEWAQSAIYDFPFTAYYYDEAITYEEKLEIVYRLNKGKPFTSIELTRVKAASIEIFQSLASHDIISSIISEKGKARYNDELLVMQSWAICFCQTPDFGTKAFRPLIENAIVSDSQVSTMHNCFDLINDLYNSLDAENEQDKRLMKKIKSRNHFVSCVYVAHKLIENGNQQAFNSTIKAFFNTTGKVSTIDQDYNYSVGSGSAKAESIAKRINALNKII